MTPEQIQIKKQIEESLDQPLIKLTSLRGGCSYPSFIATTDREQFFVKTCSDNSKVFHHEATGLNQLKNYFSDTPALHSFSSNMLILEYIENTEATAQHWKNFGANLAKLHKQPMSFFGFFEDNFIGRSKQKNLSSDQVKTSWAYFFWENRISHKLMQLKNDIGFQLKNNLEAKLKNKVIAKLSAFKSQASLLHGDLWSGNIVCAKDDKVYLIDPAVYFGDRESDIAMTECFGGFPPSFYESYRKHFPLEPGYEQRKHIYNLYHMLNHYLIFGESYKSSVEGIVDMICES